MLRLAAAQTPDATGVYRVGNGVTPPRVVSKQEPQYSEEARRAKVNANPLLTFVVREDGVPTDVKVSRSVGFRLDEEAIQAVKNTWRFEPGKKEGTPVRTFATVEVNFRLLDNDRKGQVDCLTFSGTYQPELIKGTMPSDPHTSPAHIRVGLTVTPRGEPINFRVLDSTDDSWAKDVLREMGRWRFRGGQSDTDGALEITVGNYRSPAPPSPTTPSAVSFGPPRLLLPAPSASLDAFPRLVKVQWEQVPGASSYFVEWEYSDDGTWKTGLPTGSFTASSTDASFEFLGALQGRWRVSPVNSSGQRGNASEWRTFVFNK